MLIKDFDKNILVTHSCLVITIPHNVITIPLTVSLIYLICGQWRSAGDFHNEPEHITNDLNKNYSDIWLWKVTA